MTSTLLIKIAFCLYNIGWIVAIPALRLNKRLAEGFRQRTLREKLPEADLWIQAASVGEAFLAEELLNNIKTDKPVQVLVTSNTSQGIEILKRAISEVTPNNKNLTAFAAYFPFDKPAIMAQAVRNISPKTMVLLESEIWPGHLASLKKYGCKILIINGRITSKSLSRYLFWPSLWRTLKPDKILAISKKDAERFATLFGKDRVDVMPNIKFDRLVSIESTPEINNPLESVVPPKSPFLVLGSVRQEEENLVEKIISGIHRSQTGSIIGLFPRHINRIQHWENALSRLNIPWILRSQTKHLASHGTVILWDTFGELSLAYKISRAAFVGGSLAPLGGQNFLEAIIYGVVPVIGPSWENFAWIGSEIVEKGLVRIAADWREVVSILTEDLKKPKASDKVCEEADHYIKDRQGGTAIACRLIRESLNNFK
jgi:3-deoxy-D-manno-octulosonic-acid transferase